jgi:hypothetical protein
MKLNKPEELILEFPNSIARLRNGRREILHVGDDVSLDCKGTGLEPSDDISFATVDFILLIRSNNDVDRLL